MRSKAHRKLSKGFRWRLMDRWEPEIFPAFLLVYGQPPSTHGKVDGDHCDALDALTHYHSAIRHFYHHAYLKEYTFDTGLAGKHLNRFANEFIDWARRQQDAET